MATNDFLPYAVGGGANVLSQASYAALTTLLANGLSSGIVPSNQLNKTLRQPSIMAAVIGQLIADATGQNAVDDGTIATLEANLARVIRGAAAYAADTGSANAYAITLSPAPAALVAGMGVCFVSGNANTGPSTLTVNGTSKSLTKNGSVALAAGDIPAGAIVAANYDGTRWQLRSPASGSLLNVQIFTASGTYTPTAGTNSVIVEVQGGGGAGGGSSACTSGQTSSGGGGAAGAYARSRITSGFSGVAVTVGAGGSASSAGGGGSSGGTSSFGALVSAPGGGGAGAGLLTTFPQMQGGSGTSSVATGGNILNNVGGAGGPGFVMALNAGYGGAGGQSYFGPGAGPAGGAGVSAAGGAGANKGSGGGGGFTAASGSAQVSGAGASGIVIVYEYS